MNLMDPIMFVDKQSMSHYYSHLELVKLELGRRIERNTHFDHYLHPFVAKQIKERKGSCLHTFF